MEYQKIVIGIAGFIFIITMMIFWIFSNEQSKYYPPAMSNCPTGWKVDMSGNCIIPTDGTNLGNLNGKGRRIFRNSDGTITYDTSKGGTLINDKNGFPILAYTGFGSNTKFPNFPAGYNIKTPDKNIVDFTAEGWSKYGSVLCANHEWAIKNNIHWEGVSNYNQC